MHHIMLDLETMGNGSNAAIAAIGACSFVMHPNEGSDGIISKFYEKVDLETSVAAGMHLDVSTILWWMQQSDEARKSTFGGKPVPLGDACFRFGNWVADKDAAVWGNGATFDNVIIRSAFKAVGLPIPWSFRNDKCYRTVINLLPKERQPTFERAGTAHNALDDAVTQALYLQKVYQALGLTNAN